MVERAKTQMQRHAKTLVTSQVDEEQKITRMSFLLLAYWDHSMSIDSACDEEVRAAAE